MLTVIRSQAGAVQTLYTDRLSAYEAFISFFRSRDAMRALLERSGLLRPKFRVLDAGVGFGTVTFALLHVLRAKDIDAQAIDAFDLTPAMLDRFQAELDSRGITLIRHQQANVLELEYQLSPTWRDYDLIISASMLEYVPKQCLPHALSALGARLIQDGSLLVIITRKNWITKVLIEWAGMRHAIPARSCEKPLLLRGSVILLSSDFLFDTFGKTSRTMSFWLNATVPADPDSQWWNSIRESRVTAMPRKRNTGRSCKRLALSRSKSSPLTYTVSMKRVCSSPLLE